MFTRKEIELRAERDAIKEAKKRSKEEQKELIQQTIERLNAMTASLTVDEEAPAVAETTDAEIDEVITNVDAVEASIAEEVATPAPEEVVAEDVVAEDVVVEEVVVEDVSGEVTPVTEPPATEAPAAVPE